MTVTKHISALRTLMKQHNVQAYVIPGTDPHASEYMAEHWMEMQWLSGFTGEAGTLVVTLDDARLFTDSRYYLQADIELKDTGITLMRASDVDCPTVNNWIAGNHAAKDKGQSKYTVGVNPEMWSVTDYADMREYFAEQGISLKSIDLVAPLWTKNRPAIPTSLIYPYDVRYSGESTADKTARVRKAMAEQGADALVISALDEVAWLLNIRGNDVQYNPVAIAYTVLEKDKCTLFVNPEKIDETAAAYLNNEHITTAPYNDIFPYLGQLHGRVMLDPARVNEALFEAVAADCRIIKKQSPVLKMKSRKNAVELEGERKAMLQDAIALTRFFKWLEQDAFKTPQTEWTLMEKLHELRCAGENFVEESFGTIAGYHGNGAIVHYAATPDNCAEVKAEGMLLLDSGGQYLDGTTDITRTIWLGGDIPQQARLDYTYVLKGHIALARTRFPKGTRGNQLDALAKQYMWQAGITYGHGTGHGVGHFLGCHEGPQNIRTDMNPTVLEEGQICSDEPGIYRTGKWGIRIENLVAVTALPATHCATTDDVFFGWETLTLCYYDTTLIDMTLITQDEKDWLNDYHRRVAETVCPMLNEQEAEWLKNKCKTI